MILLPGSHRAAAGGTLTARVPVTTHPLGQDPGGRARAEGPSLLSLGCPHPGAGLAGRTCWRRARAPAATPSPAITACRAVTGRSTRSPRVPTGAPVQARSSSAAYRSLLRSPHSLLNGDFQVTRGPGTWDGQVLRRIKGHTCVERGTPCRAGEPRDLTCWSSSAPTEGLRRHLVPGRGRHRARAPRAGHGIGKSSRAGDT